MMLALLILEALQASQAPWCTNSSARAVTGMYGTMEQDLLGPRGQFDQYVDVPDVEEVVGLWRQGLAQLYGFNNVEALRSFSAAAYLSPDCALCHWGVAMCFAPNINYIVENQTYLNEEANLAFALALRQPNLQNKTRTLIAGIHALVQDPDQKDCASSPARAKYANLMCSPTAGADADMDAFCAAALMDLSPWNYYEGVPSGEHFPLRDFLKPAKQRLERAAGISLSSPSKQYGGGDTTKSAPHAFAIHLFIHLMEPTNAPAAFRWEALAPAVELFDYNSTELVPHQGHLTHMPAHLFLRVGRYATGASTSITSVGNNERYLASCLVPYAHGHNLKMLVANARLAGMTEAALVSARKAAASDAGEERTPAGALACVDCAGQGCPEVPLTLLRFGRFADVLAEPMPSNATNATNSSCGKVFAAARTRTVAQQQLAHGYGYGSAFLPVPVLPAQSPWGCAHNAAYHEAAWHFARAVSLYALYASPSPSPSTLLARADREAAMAVNASARDPHYADVVPAELRAMRAWWVQGDAAAAVAGLRDAAAANDQIPYLEPPRWYYPPRQCLGYTLLFPPPTSTPTSKPASASTSISGDVRNVTNATAALEAFSADLEEYPENSFSLLGSALALTALGRADDAASFAERASVAWQDADVTLTSPCPQLYAPPTTAARAPPVVQHT